MQYKDYWNLKYLRFKADFNILEYIFLYLCHFLIKFSWFCFYKYIQINKSLKPGHKAVPSDWSFFNNNFILRMVTVCGLNDDYFINKQ